MVAMMLKEKGVPVICCCETYKFSERIMLDSIVGNEMGELLLSYPSYSEVCADHLPPSEHSFAASSPGRFYVTGPSVPFSIITLVRRIKTRRCDGSDNRGGSYTRPECAGITERLQASVRCLV